MNVSYTQLASWRRCRQQYAWRYLDRVPSAPSESLVRGDAGHAALAAWYSGKTAAEAWAQADDVIAKRGAELSDAKRTEIRTVLHDALVRYFAWSQGHDSWRECVEEVEYKIDLALFEHLPEGLKRFPLIGYIDLVIRLEDGVWLVEHKFNKDPRTKHLSLDAQCTLYCIGYWRQTGERPQGVIYNQIRLRPGGIAALEPALRSEVTRTAEGLRLAWREVRAQAAELYRARERIDAGGRAGVIYRNITHDCAWDCSYYHTCQALERTGSHEEALKAAVAEPRDLVLDEEAPG